MGQGAWTSGPRLKDQKNIWGILRLTDILLMIFSLVGGSGGGVADILGEIVNR